MVKIVELDDTETVGLASAGIGLAGSELPHKRRKSKKKITPPLGGFAGSGEGTSGAEATAEKETTAPATARPAMEESPAAAPAREENKDTARAPEGRTLGDAVMGLRGDAAAAAATTATATTTKPSGTFATGLINGMLFGTLAMLVQYLLRRFLAQ
jgi:hypothetical protein